MWRRLSCIALKIILRFSPTLYSVGPFSSTPQELNHRGTHLLFRDKKRHLNLYDIQKQVGFLSQKGREEEEMM